MSQVLFYAAVLFVFCSVIAVEFFGALCSAGE